MMADVEPARLLELALAGVGLASLPINTTWAAFALRRATDPALRRRLAAVAGLCVAISVLLATAGLILLLVPEAHAWVQAWAG